MSGKKESREVCKEMICKMEGDASSCSLLCLENETFLKEKEESTDENYIAEYDEECVQMLFDREMSFGFKQSESLVLCNYLKYARSEAITWILKVSFFTIPFCLIDF